MEKWSLCCLFLLVNIHLASSASHSLQYHHSAALSAQNFPKFTLEGLLDKEVIVCYDGNQTVPKAEWMKRNLNKPCWKKENETMQHHQKTFKQDVDDLKKHFSQTEVVHTVKLIYGCELHDDGNKTGYWRYSYNGEDFLRFDLPSGTWTASNTVCEVQQIQSGQERWRHRWRLSWRVSWYHHWCSRGCSAPCPHRLCWSFYLEEEAAWIQTCFKIFLRTL
uniref:MHC class I-like antigen recognition-like domain-containing protein n=1 Tax=Pygocentrus nattereri TaxID=42514 RepID=A0AAR2LBY1_PYGNA